MGWGKQVSGLELVYVGIRLFIPGFHRFHDGSNGGFRVLSFFMGHRCYSFVGSSRNTIKSSSYSVGLSHRVGIVPGNPRVLFVDFSEFCTIVNHMPTIDIAIDFGEGGSLYFLLVKHLTGGISTSLSDSSTPLCNFFESPGAPLECPAPDLSEDV